jgi:hypothetical protein
MKTDSFYCRYYVGHKGRFGYESMQFEITPDGKLRYANDSSYKKDFIIRKEGKRFSSVNGSTYVHVFQFVCFHYH